MEEAHLHHPLRRNRHYVGPEIMGDLVLRILKLCRRCVPECWFRGIQRGFPIGRERDIILMALGEAGRHCECDY